MRQYYLFVLIVCLLIGCASLPRRGGGELQYEDLNGDIHFVGDNPPKMFRTVHSPSSFWKVLMPEDFTVVFFSTADCPACDAAKKVWETERNSIPSVWNFIEYKLTSSPFRAELTSFELLYTGFRPWNVSEPPESFPICSVVAYPRTEGEQQTTREVTQEQFSGYKGCTFGLHEYLAGR
jgi:hypothetical protein